MSFSHVESFPSNFAQPGFADVFDDPYNPVEYYYKASSGNILSKYNIATDTTTDVNNYAISPDGIRRSYQTKSIIMHRDDKLLNLGQSASELANYTTLTTLLAGATFYTHPVNIDYMDVSFGGTIYFRANTTEIWSVNEDGTNAQLLFSLAGTAGGPLSTDPHDADSICYVDDGAIIHRYISTGVTTTVIAGPDYGDGRSIILYDGILYANFRFFSTVPTNVGYIRTTITGTDTNTFVPAAGYTWGHGFVMDTVNKVSYTLEDTKIYINYDSRIADLPDDPSVFLVVPRPVSLDVSWQATSGAISYGVTFSHGALGVNDEITSIASTTDFSHSIVNLDPNTEYSVYLYYSINTLNPSILVGSNTYTTLDNIPGNYDTSSYDDGSGRFDLGDYNADTLELIGDVMNEIFSTGDDISFNLNGKGIDARFVQRGGTVTIDQDASIAIPFITAAGAGQSVTLTLSDTSTVTVAYDETTEDVTVDGTTYSPGESFKLDGRKVTIAKF